MIFPKDGPIQLDPMTEPLVHYNKGTIGPFQQGNHWSTPTREPLVHSNKGTIGPLQQGNHWCSPTREPLVLSREPVVHSNKGSIAPLQMTKNTKIFIKRSSAGHFGTSPISKCIVFKTLHALDRDIAPKPLKWRFNSDLADLFFFSHFFIPINKIEMAMWQRLFCSYYKMWTSRQTATSGSYNHTGVEKCGSAI